MENKLSLQLFSQVIYECPRYLGQSYGLMWLKSVNIKIKLNSDLHEIFLLQTGALLSTLTPQIILSMFPFQDGCFFLQNLLYFRSSLPLALSQFCWSHDERPVLWLESSFLLGGCPSLGLGWSQAVCLAWHTAGCCCPVWAH